jgi:membrane complex biogenesis BtpA family protein
MSLSPRPLFIAGQYTLVGMVHLPPLGPAAGRPQLFDAVERFALTDAERLLEAGFPCICIENFGDTPFSPGAVTPFMVAAMTRLAMAVRRLAGPGFPLVINVLRNDAHAALSIAAAVGAAAIRVNVHSGAAVTDQGLIQGRAHETVPLRDTLAPSCRIFADVRVKHAAPLVERPITEEAEELHQRARADALIVSGAKTGGATDPARAELVRSAVTCPILVGSGATPETLTTLAPVVDGFIVGSWLKEGGRVGNPVDPARARAMADAVRALVG